MENLVDKLKQATEEIKNRTANEELRKETENIDDIEKSIGNSFEMLDDTISVKNKDAASDDSIIKVENKGTSISLEDGIEMHWCNNTACSPIPGPNQYSIGIATAKLQASPSRDVATDSPDQELRTVRPVRHFECDYGCGNDMFAMTCDFSTMTDAVELVDSGTECKPTNSLLKDSSSMTAPITSNSCHIQTEHIKTRTICVSTSPIYLSSRTADATRIIQKDSSAIRDELMERDAMDSGAGINVNFNDGKEIGQKICCNTVALQTDFEPEQNEPRIINDTEIAESLWLIPSRNRKDVAVGNDDDVIEELEITSAPDNSKLQKEVLPDSDEDDT
ncbi:hypothetical protein X798_05895, partial [Onchocerca flexuosa]